MTDELTGTLQSRGQDEGESYCVIDGTQYWIPDYVREWLAKLPDGSTVLYKFSEKKEGRKYLTKIQRASSGKAQPQAPAEKFDQKLGALISHYATGCTIRMANGDKVFALQSRFPEIELPQKIEFSVDKQGFIRSYKFRGKVDLALQDNLDRMNGPADGETIEPPGGELIKAPPQAPPNTTQKAEEKEIKTTAHADLGICSFTIGGTISLGNSENLKLEFQGPLGYRKEIIEVFKDTCDLLGKDPVTQGMITTWKNRVLGGAEE